MSILIRSLVACSALAMAACTTMEAPPADTAVAAAPAAKSALDTAIEAAGGEAALSKVKELYWSGTATVMTDGKPTKINVQTVVRPAQKWGRATTWADGKEAKTSRTLQVEQGLAWDVNRVAWTPLPAAQAENENQQFALYTMMLLTPLKSAGVTEQPAAPDGTRAIKAPRPAGSPAELKFDASGKLTGASMVVRDPKGGADITETITFSGQVESNGVKWPKRITIQQNGAPFYDLEIATFEALPAPTPRPLDQSMQYEGGQNNAGDENAG